MTHIVLPAIWLISLIAGLPQFSETVYTPSLPDIASELRVSESMVEYTLTIYLFGFAVGTLFWGKLSDKYGRKPCVLAGLAVFILGCIGCYFSRTIEMLMLNRFIQAFGGSIGSVLGQAICRDAFHGPELGKAYSSLGSSLAIFPAIGPVVGSVIAEHFGWASLFLFLTLCAVLLSLLIVFRLPETHPVDNRKPLSTIEIALRLLRDKHVLGCGLIVAACNGIAFSYFAEAPFYLMQQLGLSPSAYGLSFIAIGSAAIMGGILSRRLHKSHTANKIMYYGLIVMLLSGAAFSCLTVLHVYANALPAKQMITITLLSHMSMMFGFCMVSSNALAMALVDYKWCIGTASSLFGFFYYGWIALFTFGMGYLHNGTLLVMPLYFLGIAILILIVQCFMVRSVDLGGLADKHQSDGFCLQTSYADLDLPNGEKRDAF